MTASVLPRSRRKLISRRIVCGPKRMLTRSNSTITGCASAIAPPLHSDHRAHACPFLGDAVEDQRQQKVGDEDCNEGEHERFGRGPTDALRSRTAAEAAVA